MTEHDIIRCLGILGCRKVRPRGVEVWSTCPNEGGHQRGSDNNPSFSVRVEPSAASPCSCFACDLKDVFEHLVSLRGIHGFAKSIGPKLYRPDDFYALPASNKGVFFSDDTSPFFPPERGLIPYRGRVHRTILDRGFTVDTAKAWELGVDSDGRRAIFVVRDRKGRLRGISGRATEKGQKPKYLHYSWDTRHLQFTLRKEYGRILDFEKFAVSRVLYGEHMICWDNVSDERRFIVVCEGPTDVLWLWQAGYQAVAVQGSSISAEQCQTLLDLLPMGGAIVLGADGDAAGHKLTNGIRERLGDRVPILLPAWEKGADPASTKVADLHEIICKSKLVNIA